MRRKKYWPRVVTRDGVDIGEPPTPSTMDDGRDIVEELRGELDIIVERANRLFARVDEILTSVDVHNEETTE